MSRIFPAAHDYKTVNLRVSESARTAIETRTGKKLLPGQREQFQYFEMTNAENRRIGTIIAASQKGEFGAVEFVFGLDTTNTIAAIYIQRSRERDASFKKREFLDQFVGLGMKDLAKLHSLEPVVKVTRPVQAVVDGVLKELIAYEELVVKK